MAFFLKFVTSIVLGGGLGYALFQFTVPDESDLIKHLPPHSSEQQNLFKPSYRKQPERFMNQGRPDVSFKEFKVHNSVNDTEK